MRPITYYYYYCDQLPITKYYFLGLAEHTLKYAYKRYAYKKGACDQLGFKKPEKYTFNI